MEITHPTDVMKYLITLPLPRHRRRHHRRRRHHPNDACMHEHATMDQAFSYPLYSVRHLTSPQ